MREVSAQGASPTSSRLRQADHCRSWSGAKLYVWHQATLPSSGEATPLGDSTVSPLDERCVVTLAYGVPPPGIACGVSANRFTAPRYRNSASVSLFISHPASFPSRVSSVMSIMSFHTEIPAQNPSTTTFTELRDRILATKIVYVHDTIVRASSWRSLQLVPFETYTLNDYSGLPQTPRNLI